MTKQRLLPFLRFRFLWLVASLMLVSCQGPAVDQASSKSDAYVPHQAQVLPEMLTSTDEYLPDFSYAGYRNGEEALPKVSGQVFDVTDYGASPDDGLDDSKSVLTALAAATSHSSPAVLKFPAGRFILSEILYVERSDFAIQGEGEATTLYFPRPLKYLPTPSSMEELSEYLTEQKKRQREKQNNIDLPFSLYA